jgi:hypothetical protein
MSEGRVPWHHVGNRITGNPFASLGITYCTFCKVEVEADTESWHRGKTWCWRRKCPRCGNVISWGVYHNVPLFLPGQDEREQVIARRHIAQAKAFVTKPGADRRGPVRGRASL